ncbi:hypothetical protein HDV00_007405 [Rhizophlyctis rosea]|nr:hypothetical protein HDV00_007405 [Rhizophlyctis rosea]
MISEATPAWWVHACLGNSDTKASPSLIVIHPAADPLSELYKFTSRHNGAMQVTTSLSWNHLHELYLSGQYDLLLNQLLTLPERDPLRPLFAAIACLQLREPETVLTHTSRAIENTSPNRSSYYYALSHYVSSIAHEQLEQFTAALNAVQAILSVAGGNAQLQAPEGVPEAFKVFRGLKHPHPAHPQNFPHLLDRQKRLAVLVGKSCTMKSETPPPALRRSNGAAESNVTVPLAFLYRIQPRVLLETLDVGVPIRLEFALSNESGLWRRADHGSLKDAVFSIELLIKDADKGLRASDAVQLTVVDKTAIGPSGHFTVSFTIACRSSPPTTLPPHCLHISSTHSFILPLLLGPIPLSSSTMQLSTEENTAIYTSYRTFAIPSPPHTLLIQDDPAGGIPTRIWDSCIAFMTFISTVLSPHAPDDSADPSIKTFLRKPSLRILELGAGTGTGGLFLAACCPGSKAILTDMEGALTPAQQNLHLNQHLLTTLRSSVSILPLTWGTTTHIHHVLSPLPFSTSQPPVQSPTSQPPAQPSFDMILCLDIIYELEHIACLIDMLERVCGDETEVWVVYKRRGLDEEDERGVWGALVGVFEVVGGVGGDGAAFGLGGRVDLGELGRGVGCWLWRFRRRWAVFGNE